MERKVKYEEEEMIRVSLRFQFGSQAPGQSNNYAQNPALGPQFKHHSTTCQKCKPLGPTPELLTQNLHFDEPLR